MSDSFGLKIGLEGEKEFKKALAEINRSFKVLGSEMELVASQFDKQDTSVEALTARNQVLGRSIDAQKQKITTLEQALENASESFGENDRRTQQWQIQLNKARASLNKMEQELSANEQAMEAMSDTCEDADDAAGQLADSVQDAGNEAEKTGSRLEGLSGIAKGLGAALGAAMAAIGAAAVAAGGELLTLGDAYNQAVHQISATTGVTGTELEALGEIAQRVYTHNFGENLMDVADGLSTVSRATGLMGEQLELATEAGFALRDTFGYELQESARTANALMQNFGLSAAEAYDLIATGAQKGADQNGDLLDILNEYSAQYAALGLSAGEFLTGLIQGSDAGLFSLDKLGDAVKEFNIRAKDGSTTTSDAFSALGMNAEEMMARFASGGDAAREAFFSVVSALNGMEDPIAKNTAAVGLFGTMYEDLEANVLPVLAGMQTGAVEVKDALAQISSVRYDNLESALEGTKRSIEGAFLPSIREVSAAVTDIFATLSTQINGANGDFGKISQAVGQAVGELATVATEQLPAFLQLGAEIIGAVGAAMLDNLPLLMDTAGQLGSTVLNGVLSALPQVTQGAVQLILTLSDGLLQNLPALAEAAVSLIAGLATGLAEAAPELLPVCAETVAIVAQTLAEHAPMLLESALSLILGLADGILQTIPQLIEALPQVIAAVVEFLVSSSPQIAEAGVQLLGSLVSSLPAILSAILSAIPQILQSLCRGFLNGVPQLAQVGVNLVRGIGQGIASMASWLYQQASSLVNNVVGSVKSLLGINSPSRVFADIGENMGLGMGVGFVDSMQDVARDMRGAIPTDFDIRTSLHGVDSAMYPAGQTSAVCDLTIPLTLNGTTLARVLAELQWSQNAVHIRNLGMV